MKGSVKSVFGFLLLGAIIAYCLESCKTKLLASTSGMSNTVQIYAVDIPRITPYMRPKKDTVKVELTDRQRLFYDKYFVPQFESLRLVINAQSRSLSSQAQSIAELTGTLQQMRQRSIRRNDSMQNIQLNDKLEYSKLEKIYLDVQKKQVAKNASQITDLKNITDILLTVAGALIIGFIFLLILVAILWKKIDNLSKRLNYA